MSDQHHHFHYIELPSTDNEAMKRFYGTVFGWTFQDYGPSYVAILGAGKTNLAITAPWLFFIPMILKPVNSP